MSKPDPRQWALDQVDSADVEGWLAAGLKGAERAATKRLDELTAGPERELEPLEVLQVGAAAIAVDGVKALRARPGFVPSLARVGRATVRQVLAQLVAGERDAARVTFLHARATLLERRMASAASTDRANAAADARAEAFAEIEAGLEELGEVAAQVALPLLLTALKGAI